MDFFHFMVQPHGHTDHHDKHDQCKGQTYCYCKGLNSTEGIRPAADQETGSNKSLEGGPENPL